MTVLRARGGELERDFTFGVAIQLFEPLLESPTIDREALLSGAASLSKPLFSGAAASPEGTGDEFPFLHGLHWLAANAAVRAPLMLAVDDAHWSDALSLRWLVYLLQRLDELPIALIVSARPDESGPQAELTLRIARHRLTTERSLSSLSEEAVAELVRAELGETDEELVSTCVAATGGNPFYVRDFVAGMRAGGQRAHTDRLAAEPVSGAVLGRVASLPEPAPALAGAVAVLGSGAPLERAAALAGISADEAASAADALAGVAILERGARLAFVHPLVREAIYSNLPEAQRARAHARAAELLRDDGADPEQVASHLVEAGGAVGEWAAAALRAGCRAGERARRPDRRGSLPEGGGERKRRRVRPRWTPRRACPRRDQDARAHRGRPCRGSSGGDRRAARPGGGRARHRDGARRRQRAAGRGDLRSRPGGAGRQPASQTTSCRRRCAPHAWRSESATRRPIPATSKPWSPAARAGSRPLPSA